MKLRYFVLAACYVGSMIGSEAEVGESLNPEWIKACFKGKQYDHDRYTRHFFTYEDFNEPVEIVGFKDNCKVITIKLLNSNTEQDIKIVDSGTGQVIVTREIADPKKIEGDDPNRQVYLSRKRSDESDKKNMRFIAWRGEAYPGEWFADHTEYPDDKNSWGICVGEILTAKRGRRMMNGRKRTAVMTSGPAMPNPEAAAVQPQKVASTKQAATVETPLLTTTAAAVTIAALHIQDVGKKRGNCTIL